DVQAMKFTAGLLRLRRPMCGRPVAFRESPPNQSGLCPGGRAQPEIYVSHCPASLRLAAHRAAQPLLSAQPERQ
ncbi:MAG TPA: hypothetical protein VFV58_38180, partial [Blastocatellia bacterium]|nr:hypothetical protein [Blastocatellia bacterium]